MNKLLPSYGGLKLLNGVLALLYGVIHCRDRQNGITFTSENPFLHTSNTVKTFNVCRISMLKHAWRLDALQPVGLVLLSVMKVINICKV